MSSKLVRSGLPALLAASLLVVGCGLEGLFNTWGGEYPQPVSRIRGTLAFPDPKITVLDSLDNKITPFQMTVDGGTYEVDLYSGAYSGLRLRAIQGEAILEAFVPPLAPEETVGGVDLDVSSTAAVKFVEGLLGPSGKTLPMLSDDLVCIMDKKARARMANASSAPGKVAEMMGRVLEHADLNLAANTQVFQTPKVARDAGAPDELVVVDSVLEPGWVARNLIDYDNDGLLNQNTSHFDEAFLASIQPTDAGTPDLDYLTLSAPPLPDKVRVVFSVDFNDGKLDGNCARINRFRWVRDQPNKQMYFVGGIHKTSPIQSPVIDAMLGNRGGWTPNQIKMYDDGTHGDKVAGDNIWSIYFDLPRTLRMGYKYTWGHQGDLWTGTEEWPGNQRILEVDDVSGDGYVYRFDNFGDEATNKDLYNLNPASGGALDWNEDLNGDGFSEAEETPIDTQNNCQPSTYQWVTPDWVPALTVPCDQYVAP